MAELLAVGNTAANSADFVLIEGQSKTLNLKNDGLVNIPDAARVLLYIKSGSLYFPIDRLDGRKVAGVLTAAGTFRVSRLASSESVGVDIS